MVNAGVCWVCVFTCMLKLSIVFYSILSYNSSMHLYMDTCCRDPIPMPARPHIYSKSPGRLDNIPIAVCSVSFSPCINADNALDTDHVLIQGINGAKHFLFFIVLKIYSVSKHFLHLNVNLTILQHFHRVMMRCEMYNKALHVPLQLPICLHKDTEIFMRDLPANPGKKSTRAPNEV